MFAKQLTPKSWVLSNAKTNKSLGMVNLRDDNKFYLLGVKESFDSLNEIASKQFKTSLKNPEDSVKNTKVAVTDINGFPVKHAEACEFETIYVGTVAIETYKLAPGSKKVYAAGWIALLLDTHVGGGIGVLTNRLFEGGFLGPFRTELDLQFATKQYNNGKEK